MRPLHFEIQSLQRNGAEGDRLAPNLRDLGKSLDVAGVRREDDVGVANRRIKLVDAPFHLVAD